MIPAGYYDPSMDRPHLPGAEPHWQESDCCWFYDEQVGVGGFLRIGQMPNARQGQLIVYAFKQDGPCFRWIRNDYPAEQCRVWGDGQEVGGAGAQALSDLRMRYWWRHEDSTAELEFHQAFHDPRPWSLSGEDGDFNARINTGGHSECSGRIRGTLQIGGEHYAITALAHRDRSWGARGYAGVVQHRMHSGTVGPDLSWATTVIQFKDGSVHALGYVHRGDTSVDVEDVQILATVDYDGLTVRQGEGRFRLKDGSTLVLPCQPIHGFLTPVPQGGFVSTDHIALVEHEGRRGFCNLECSFPRNPEGVEDLLSDIYAGTGLSMTRRYG